MTRAIGIFLFVFSTVCAAGPHELVDATADLNLAVPLKVVLAGRYSDLPQGQVDQVTAIVQVALKWARDLAPPSLKHHFFSPPEDGYPDHQFALLLTDSQDFHIGTERFTWTADSDAKNFWKILRYSDQSYKQDLLIGLRLDRILFNDEGKIRPGASFALADALMKQIYGSWQEHLETPLEEIDRLGSTSPAVIEERIASRQNDVSESLLSNSKLLKMNRAGDFLGVVYAAWVGDRFDFSHRNQTEDDILAVPFGVHWGEETYSKRKPEILQLGQAVFFRSMHLVSALAPEHSLFSRGDRGAETLKEKNYLLYLMDTDDAQALGRYPFGASVRDPNNLVSESGVAGVPGFSRAVLFSALWTDRVLFDGTQGLKPNALALLSVALAAETWGAIPAYLHEPSPQMPSDSLGAVRLRIRVLRAGVDFVERLEKHPLWGTLSDAEKAAFTVVRAGYATELGEWESCANRLLIQPSRPLLPEH
jgi:hypothetical protein